MWQVPTVWEVMKSGNCNNCCRAVCEIIQKREAVILHSVTLSTEHETESKLHKGKFFLRAWSLNATQFCEVLLMLNSDVSKD